MKVLALALAGLAAAGGGTAGAADRFDFLTAPQINLSLLYRLDRLTGEVIACQFAKTPGRTDVGPGAFGITVCYRAGDGSTGQPPGDYALLASRHEQEGGVFRVDRRSGAISICYLYFQRVKQGEQEKITDQYVVCSAASK